jgi:hypothetical protein
MKDKTPLTPEEVQAASDKFFPLFDIIHRQMPEDASVCDTLDVMENVCKLAQAARANEPVTDFPFGFKKKDKENQENQEE